MWKNKVERDRPQMVIGGVRSAFWKSKAACRHSEYVIFIVFL